MDKIGMTEFNQCDDSTNDSKYDLNKNQKDDDKSYDGMSLAVVLIFYLWKTPLEK